MKNSSSIDINMVEARVSRHHIGRLKVRRGKTHVAPVVVVCRKVAFATSDEDIPSFDHALFQMVVDTVAALFKRRLTAVTEQGLAPEPLNVLQRTPSSLINTISSSSIIRINTNVCKVCDQHDPTQFH